MNSEEISKDLRNLLSDVKQFPKKMKKRNWVLFYCGTLLMLLFALFLVGGVVCQYSLYELCHWLKPGKFSVSFAVYAFTIGWYLEYLKDSVSQSALKVISWVVATLMLLDMSLMIIQSWMASESYSSLHISPHVTHMLKDTFHHLNNMFIFTNTVIALLITMFFFQANQLKPRIYLWSIRLSFVIFLLSCSLGSLMLLHYGPLDPDSDNLGIPFTQFTSLRNNLVSIHFLGIHSIQIIPFITYYSRNYLKKRSLSS